MSLVAQSGRINTTTPFLRSFWRVRSQPARRALCGVFGITRRTVFGFAISQLCAGNPALPQSVPSSVLLNLFIMTSPSILCRPMPGETACATSLRRRPLTKCNIITLHLHCGRQDSDPTYGRSGSDSVWRRARTFAVQHQFNRIAVAVATSREGQRSRARSLGTPQRLALRFFQGASRPHQDCRRLRQLLKCEHTLQSFSDRRRPQTNIHSSARFAAPRTRARLPNQPQSH